MMDKVGEVTMKFPGKSTMLTAGVNAGSREREVRIEDNRVAQLLLVLQEIDICINRFGQFSDDQLSALVHQAALACGFVEPSEARGAIAAILDAMDPRQFLNRTYS